jgi:hypothetical protein
MAFTRLSGFNMFKYVEFFDYQHSYKGSLTRVNLFKGLNKFFFIQIINENVILSSMK